MKKFTRTDAVIQTTGERFKQQVVIKRFRTEDGKKHEFTTFLDEGSRAGAVLAIARDGKVVTMYQFRPGPEHRWGIAAPERRAGVLAAQIALIAVEGRDETLLRSVMVETPRLPVWTERELTGEELVGALAWARFPQSHEATLAQLAVLGLDEKTRMSAEYRAQLAEQAELSLELREVQEADLAGWSAKGTLIGAV